MKYTAETTENGVTETLELDGSIYKKRVGKRRKRSYEM